MNVLITIVLVILTALGIACIGVAVGILWSVFVNGEAYMRTERECPKCGHKFSPSTKRSKVVT